jgi:hypothetical protein
VKGREVRVGVMIDNEMHAFDILRLVHWQVALDDHRHDPPVFRNQRHVQRDMSSFDSPVTKEPLENAGDFLVGYFRIGSRETNGGRQGLRTSHSAGGKQAGDT